MDIRKQIKARMELLGWTPYRLHQELGDQVTRSTVYNFVNRERSISTEDLGAILDALGITLTVKDAKRK